MTRTGWIALALVVTAGVLWIVTSWSTRNEPQAAPSETVTVDVPAAAEPIAARAPEEEPAPAAPLDPAPPTPAAEPHEPTAAPSQPDVSPLPPPERTGPVDELKARFEKEPRDSSAGALEKHIEAAFRTSDVPAGLLKSVLCRRTVCRVQTRWTPERAIGFMAGFTRLLMIPPDDPRPRLLDSNLAISPEGEADEGGERLVDVYIARLPDAEPAQ